MFRAVAVLALFAVVSVSAIKGDQQATCDALIMIADDTETANCTTNGEEDCDMIRCMTTFPIFGKPNVILYNITILPCNKPPAVNLDLDAAGIKFNQNFTMNTTAEIFTGIVTTDVTVIQYPDAIGVEARILAPSFSVDNTVIEFTRIPINCMLTDSDDTDSGSIVVKGEVLSILILSLLLATVYLA